MREIERIDRILQKLAVIWKAQPDTRFHQLMENMKYTFPKGFKIDAFHFEDTNFEAILDKTIEELKRGRS